MIILPDRNIPRGRLLLPVPAREWRTPSQAQPKDTFGNEDQTRFRLTARLHDGHIVWRGWFDDRDDYDAFLFALVTGSLRYERELWRLPTPQWHPGLGEDIRYDFNSLTFLTATTGSNQTFTSASDWNNASNTIEGLGAGASGSACGATNFAGGGGGGAYFKIANFSFAVPGTTTATYQLGTGGTAITTTGTGTNGVVGGDTWFNNTVFPGAGTDNSQGGAKGGSGGTFSASASAASGTGGVGTSGWGQTRNNGGNGIGAGANPNFCNGGGAAGLNGAGSNASASTGGRGDVSSGGTGGAGSGNGTTASNGNPGTEWDASHGSGGGGGGAGNGGGANTGGNGGLYGAAGGGASGGGSASNTSGVGRQGMVVLTSLNQVPWNPWPQLGPILAS